MFQAQTSRSTICLLPPVRSHACIVPAAVLCAQAEAISGASWAATPAGTTVAASRPRPALPTRSRLDASSRCLSHVLPHLIGLTNRFEINSLALRVNRWFPFSIHRWRCLKPTIQRFAEQAPRSRKRVTHRDVARLAAVSTAVVSYVINNGPRAASPEARARVLKAIEDLDYHPNAVARGLRAQRTHTIGFIARDYSPLDVFVSPFSAAVLTGLAVELKDNGYYLLVHPLGIGEDLAPLGRLLRSGRLDGVVVRLVDSTPNSDALLELVAAAGLPCVCLERPVDPRFGFGSVLFNNVDGGHTATAYLVSQGHRRIAHLGGDPLYESARARRVGYERALREAGLPIDAQLIQGGSWDPTTVDAAVRTLRGLADPPTAIFAANDSLAFRAVEDPPQRWLPHSRRRRSRWF